MFRRLFRLPTFSPGHEPALRVPKGGSSCANCKFFVAGGGPHGACVEPNFERYYKTTLLPCPPDEFCSDWYQPTTLLKLC